MGVFRGARLEGAAQKPHGCRGVVAQMLAANGCVGPDMQPQQPQQLSSQPAWGEGRGAPARTLPACCYPASTPPPLMAPYHSHRLPDAVKVKVKVKVKVNALTS